MPVIDPFDRHRPPATLADTIDLTVARAVVAIAQTNGGKATTALVQALRAHEVAPARRRALQAEATLLTIQTSARRHRRRLVGSLRARYRDGLADGACIGAVLGGLLVTALTRLLGG